MGNSGLDAQMVKHRLSRIPGKMKKRIWIREGDVVLIKPWDFQSDEKADVIWRYTRTEANGSNEGVI